VRCEAILAQGPWLGPDAALVFSITGLLLALPAVVLPFITAGKLGDERVSLLFTGVLSLWEQGLRATAVLVLLTGGILPLLLLASLAILHAPGHLGWPQKGLGLLFDLARHLEEWAIPEVQVLAVFVALMKLGSLVNVTIGPGFWCYCAMTLALLMAQRSFDFDSTGLHAATREPDAPLPP
jgi:paraquat-inducible protein A